MQCGIRGCVNEKGKVTPDCRMHKVPPNEPERSKWLALIRRQDTKPDVCLRICSLHFNESDYQSPPSVVKSAGLCFRLYLKRGATPSQNLPCASQQSKRQRLRSITRTADEDGAIKTREQTSQHVVCIQPGTAEPVEIVELCIPSTSSTDDNLTVERESGVNVERVSATAEYSNIGSSVMADTPVQNLCSTEKAAAVPQGHQAPHKPAATQTWEPAKRTVGVQTAKLRQHVKGCQANLHARTMRSSRIQTDLTTDSSNKKQHAR
ncbi:uncharacterized protein LOC135394341 isoform X2 [Ornithodoros turicata]|uniref:uncharacterized protein LOC135394341 isoform X2 n=1 Tax=Ornithodoros turicata TaxID=34597 RepID=UPI003138B3BE